MTGYRLEIDHGGFFLIHEGRRDTFLHCEQDIAYYKFFLVCDMTSKI